MDFKKLYDSAITPTRGSEYAAGYDLYACGYENNMTDGTDWSVFINPGDTIKINTGIAVAIPKGCFGGVYARSGLACKSGLAPANKVAVVDSEYRGEIIVALHNHSKENYELQCGERIAQMVFTPYYMGIFKEEKLSSTKRGAGGFCSTGKK